MGKLFKLFRVVLPVERLESTRTKYLSLTSFFEQPICENGHGPSTFSQSPKTGSW